MKSIEKVYLLEIELDLSFQVHYATLNGELETENTKENRRRSEC